MAALSVDFFKSWLHLPGRGYLLSSVDENKKVLTSDGPNLGQIAIPEPINCVLSSSGHLIARAGEGPSARRRARSVGDEAADTPPVGWLPCPALCCPSHRMLPHRQPLGPSEGPDSGGVDREQSPCSPHSLLLAFEPLPRSCCNPSHPEGVVCFFFLFFFLPQYLIYTSVPMHLLDLCAYRSPH